MASPNLDSSLNDVVIEYLKKVKCEKASKMFESKCASENTCLKPLSEFIKFLKQKETMKESVEDDLGFEINFGVYQQEVKLPATIARQPNGQKLKIGSKNESTKKEDIPNEFIKQIQRLGMKVEDAELLYKTKINWTAVYLENKLYCTEHGCEFFTKIDGDELRNHMVVNHNYGEYPCPYQDCDYVGVSKVSDFKIDKA